MTQKQIFASQTLFLLSPTSSHAMSDEGVFTWSRLVPLIIWIYFLPMTGLSKISCFHTSFTRQGCLTNSDHMSSAVRNIKSYVMHISATNQEAWLDLSFGGMTWILLHFKPCNAGLHDQDGTSESPKTPALFGRSAFVHTCWALRQSEPVTQALRNYTDWNHPF